jgi:hypothetical protein
VVVVRVDECAVDVEDRSVVLRHQAGLPGPAPRNPAGRYESPPLIRWPG